MSEKQFITTDIKQNDAFKQQLANMARGDAHHDLDEVFKRKIYENDANIKTAFDAGIPAKPNTYYDEPNCLSSIILEVVGITGNDKIENLKKVTNVTNDADNELEPTIVKVGLNSDTYFNYDVVQFIIECSTNTKTNPKLEPYDGKNFGNDFFERVSLGGITNNDLGTNASIIVDFTQHHFMEKLGEGERTSNSNTIYYLMTPEVVNDPAGKTNIHNKSVFENKNGVKLVSCLQNTPNPMSYTKYNPFEANPLNNFFSNYDFSLLPIKQVFTSVKNEKLISTLNINYDRGGKVPFTDTIEDSKGENSITTVIGYLRSIIQKLTKNTFGGTSNDVNKKHNLQFNFNSKVQQKRGGDWFQALSCLDAKNRTYTQILPGNSRQQIDNSVLGPVYFVTHDQIAVSYALLNGANVIYMDYYGRIYVFKNRGDPIFAEGAIPIEELLLTGMKDFWLSPTNSNLKEKCIRLFNIYTDSRVRLIKTYKDLLNESISVLRNFVTDNDNTINLNNTTFTNNLTKSFKDLFNNAVTLAFVLDNFAEININSDAVSRDYNEILESNSINAIEHKEIIIKLNTNLNILKGLYDKFGDINANDSGLVFPNWIVKNVKKIDVYKAVTKLDFYEYVVEKNNTLSKRLINLVFNSGTPNVNNTEPNKTTDKHIFLPYIQTLPRNQLESILTALSIINIEFKSKNTITENSSTSSRSGKPANQVIYLNNVLNLIYEANLLLKKPLDKLILDNTSEENVFGENETYNKSINELKESIEGVWTLQSTDNIIVKEDLAEIEILKTGKESSSTMFDDNDVPVVAVAPDNNQTGGGWNKLTEGSRGENVICDVSVKQITWQLLNCILLENCSLQSLLNIINSYTSYVPDVQPTEKFKYFLGITSKNVPYDVNQFAQDEFIQSILELIPAAEEKERYRDNIIQLSSAIGSILFNAGMLYFLYFNHKIGGGDNSDDGDDTNTGLLLNFNMGYHPLMPIYMLLSPFYYTLGPKAQGDPFFYTYFTYFNILEKMVDVLENNYLNESSNNIKILSSYVIGFALRSLLFTSNTSSLQSKKILEVVDIPQEDFSTFSLKNDSFSNLIMGTFHSNPEEDIAAFILLDSDLFNNFINKEVNIKNILQQGTQIDNLPTYNVLKDKIYNLLSRIVSKINIDRGTPENNITVNNMEYLQTPPSQSSDAIAKGIPGLSTQERLQRIEEQQKQSLLNPKPALESDTLRPFDPSRQKTALDVSTFSNGDSSNMVTSNLSTNVGNIGRGGKTKKYRKKQTKRKTNKKHNKKDNKKSKNITRKHRKKKHNKKTKTNTKRFKKQ
jgi:hypothetical protein